MGVGIMVCGLNGAGKTTLGKALAEKLHFYHIDSEDLFFPKTDPHCVYAHSRTREAAERLLFREIARHKNFVFTSVTGDYGHADRPFFQYVVWVETSRALRLQRIRERSLLTFGNRVLPGGDLYEREKGFYDFAQARPEELVAEWVRTLPCPVIRVDGAKPVEGTAALVAAQIQTHLKGSAAAPD